MVAYVAYVLVIVLYGPHNTYSRFSYYEPSFESCFKHGSLLDKAMDKKYKHYTIECQHRYEVDI